MSRSISIGVVDLAVGMEEDRHAGLSGRRHDAIEMRPPLPLHTFWPDEQPLVVGEVVGQEDDVHPLGDRAADQLGEIVGRAGHQLVEQLGLLHHHDHAVVQADDELVECLPDAAAEEHHADARAPGRPRRTRGRSASRCFDIALVGPDDPLQVGAAL